MSGTQQLTFLGCGDAFNSGGRLHTCLHVASNGVRFLMDCGASALAGFKRFGADSLDIDAILITHFHADHFCGLPLFLVESKIRKRTRTLPIAGPTGIRDYFDAALRALLPGTPADFGFDIEFREYGPHAPLEFCGLEVRAFPVIHVPETHPHALRVSTGNSVIAYSGDTEWTDVLIDVARDADLFVCEASTLDRPIRNHVDYETIRSRRDDLACRRLLLTHMGPDVIAAAERIHADGVAIPAHDGFQVSF
jgi:ribonuclease BN (tRNA processing enzyme)